jgi:hypothetical protein
VFVCSTNCEDSHREVCDLFFGQKQKEDDEKQYIRWVRDMLDEVEPLELETHDTKHIAPKLKVRLTPIIEGPEDP